MTFFERWKRNFERGGRLPNAYLFQGPKGSGKREAAEEIAGTLLGRIENHPDFIRITLEKTTIKIETIRDLIQKLSLRPVESDRRVVVIEEADAMTDAAANALLKTLEEPPQHTLFILISEASERLPATIRSRCQRVSFQVSRQRIEKDLGEIFSSWQDRMLPLFESGSSFSRLSQFAESVAKEPDQIPSLFELLKGLWHDLSVYHCNTPPLLPAAIPWTQKEADRRDRERLFQELDLILQTERAIEGNVNKTLALERLFEKLIASPSGAC